MLGGRKRAWVGLRAGRESWGVRSQGCGVPSPVRAVLTPASVLRTDFRTAGRVGAFPGGPAGKESTCDAGDAGSIPGSRRSPGEGHGHPLQYSCLGNPRWQRSLAG